MHRVNRNMICSDKVVINLAYAAGVEMTSCGMKT